MIDFGININLKEDLTAGVKGLRQAFSGLFDDVEDTKDGLKDLRKAASDVKLYERLQKGADKHGKTLDEQRAKVIRLRKELANSENMSASQLERKTAQLAKAETRLSQLEDKQNEYNRELQQTGSALRKAGVNTDRLGDEQDRLGREIDQTTRKLARQKQVAGGVRNVFGGLRQVGAGLATSAKGLAMGGVAGAVAGGGILNSFIGTAATAERSRSVLTTLEGGDTEKANEAFDWISDFAASTPYELQQVTDAFVKLRAYGIDPIEDDALKTYGDTAAAMGKDINQVVEAVADALTGENERLKDFGIKASTKGNTITYNYTDKDGMQRYKEVDKNNRDMIKSTLESIWNEKYEGAMENMSGTWIGMMSNLKDKWTRFQLMVMDSGAFDWLKEQLGDILFDIEFMSRNGELQAWAKDISAKFVETAKDIKEGLSGLWDFAKKVGNALSSVANFVGGWENLAIILVSLKGIVMAGGLIGGLTSIAGGVKAIAAAFGIASIPILAVAAAFAAVAAAWYFWDDIVGWVKESFPGLYKLFAEDIPNMFSLAANAVKSVWGGITDWLEKKFVWLKDALLWVREGLKDLGFTADNKAIRKDISEFADFGGGRANGGLVELGRYYRVNEFAPELFERGGKQFLMPQSNGRVTPLKQLPSGITKQATQQQTMQGRLEIVIDSPVPVKVKRAESEGLEIDITTGPIGLLPT